ncbi:hypothetical protein [Luteococcus peritonei]|uniref:Phosphatidylinositol mannoside acyltransferase n=1 Tax=Luteococcus peritonei TaxID=88874 RepID=A0ABW4RXQ1_9ACTN
MSRYYRALRVAERVPPALWRPGLRAASWLVAIRPPRPVRQWQLNAATATGREPGRALTARAVASWGRNLFESVQLGRWSPQQVERSVLIDQAGRERLFGAHRDGGVVVALPHMGSWDLAGAWACQNGLMVSTVAEQLGEQEFAFFVRVREELGMRVYGHREPMVLARLEGDQREGRMVCLLADRMFARRGTPVAWPVAGGEQQVRMPGGPAHLALATGSTLLGIACHYEGSRMRLVVSEPIVAQDDDPVTTMNQQLACFFARQVRTHVEDWHMLQPFFSNVVAR